MNKLKSPLLLSILSLGLWACGGDSKADPDAGSTADAASVDECTAGETRCDADGLQSCEDVDGTLVFGTAEACGEDQICSEDACVDVSAVLQQQATAVRQYADDLRDFHGYVGTVDFEQLKADAIAKIFAGDESDYTLSKAVFAIFKAVPQGHGAIGFGSLDYADCFDPEGLASLGNSSWYGVCARSAGDASILTFAPDGNVLGLNPGDKVIGAVKDGETWSAPNFLSRIGEEPLCAASHPSASSQADFSATNIFALVDEGDSLEVERVNGTIETIAVPARAKASIGCSDPFRRASRTSFFTTSQREDGVVVAVLPTLGNHADHPFPAQLTLASYRGWVADAINLINADLEQYTGITGLVWDIRGNRGGAPEYGMALMGTLGASEGNLGNCYGRVVASDPVAFDETASQYPFPYQIFADSPVPSIAFDGNQAVVADGIAVSAADWLLYRADALGIPTFGHGGSGAYGYTTGPSYVNKSIAPVADVHLGISSYIAGMKCLDSEDNVLEGRAPIGTVVDFTPEDLANGVDTQIEAAAAAVLK